MSLSDRYQEFGNGPGHGDAEAAEDDALSDARLQGFENGYQAGWDDAMKAHQTARDRISADFAQNLEDMSFTYQEAYSKLCTAMRPLIVQIVTKLLPETAGLALGAQIFDQVGSLIEAQAENAVEIAVSPENLPALEAMLGEAFRTPFALVAEPSLGPGQVYLRVNRAEREINLDAVMTSVRDAVDAFFEQADQEPPA